MKSYLNEKLRSDFILHHSFYTKIYSLYYTYILGLNMTHDVQKFIKKVLKNNLVIINRSESKTQPPNNVIRIRIIRQQRSL
jgi:hypothetical protein